ncbi:MULTISPECIES: phage tail protein [Dyella]|uniref:Phage tail protein n=2 Tax=Dyella TaxID=231454 RepID=A0A4R0YLY7_9GAMM|nr:MULTISPECIES: tail fiber protein [Dyella]TBR35965.1 phage tail protein [Dyella terrae]TCI08488.1 phage tail protein [Dyella soli]
MTPYLGEIRLLPYTRVPLGWMECNGALVSIAENDALYTLLGTTYGGDGVQTFGLPNLQSRVAVHQGTGQGLSTRVLGQVGGKETVTLTAQTMPTHTHIMHATTTTATANAPSNALEYGAVGGDTMYSTTVDVNSATFLATSVTMSGGNLPHDNIMPTVAVRYFICVSGVFPTQN